MDFAQTYYHYELSSFFQFLHRKAATRRRALSVLSGLHIKGSPIVPLSPSKKKKYSYHKVLALTCSPYIKFAPDPSDLLEVRPSKFKEEYTFVRVHVCMRVCARACVACLRVCGGGWQIGRKAGVQDNLVGAPSRWPWHRESLQQN